MTNKIRVKDLILYFTELSEYWNGVNSTQRVLYEEARKKYQTTIWSRWFGQKFEESSAGTLSWISTRWDDLINSRDHIRDCESAIKKCTYFHKCGNEVMDWSFSGFSESKFFNWCSKNNIPY